MEHGEVEHEMGEHSSVVVNFIKYSSPEVQDENKKYKEDGNKDGVKVQFSITCKITFNNKDKLQE